VNLTTEGASCQPIAARPAAARAVRWPERLTSAARGRVRPAQRPCV